MHRGRGASDADEIDPPESVERRRWWISSCSPSACSSLVPRQLVSTSRCPRSCASCTRRAASLQWMATPTRSVRRLLLTMGSLGDKYGRRPATPDRVRSCSESGPRSRRSWFIRPVDSRPGRSMGVGGRSQCGHVVDHHQCVPAHERRRRLPIWTRRPASPLRLGPSSVASCSSTSTGDRSSCKSCPSSWSVSSQGAFLIPDSATRGHRD